MPNKKWELKFILIPLFLILFPNIFFAQTETECKPFHKGYFLFEANENETYLIRRKRNKQIEINLQSQQKVGTKIKWFSDCVYQLKYSKSQENDTTSLKEIPVFVRINEIEGNQYSFIVSGFDELIEFKGKVEKIRRRKFRQLKLF